MSEKKCKFCGNGDRLDLEYAIKDFKPTDDVVCANMSNCRERMNGIINLVHSELDRRIRKHMDDYRDYEETCKELEQARAEVERLKAKNARMRKIVASTMTEADMRLEGILDDQEGGR